MLRLKAQLLERASIMTKREVASLALKILGIYAFIISVSVLQSMVLMIATYSAQYTDHPNRGPGLSSLATGSIISLLLLIFLGCFLITASEKLSRLIFPKDVAEERVLSLASKDAQTIAFSIVGVLLLARAVPRLFGVIVQISHLCQESPFSRSIKWRAIESSVVLVVQFALGLYLFLGSKGLSGLWHKMQQTKGM